MQALLMLMRFFWHLLSNKTRTNRQAAPHLQRCISCRWHVVLGLSCVIAADLRTQAGKIRAQKPKQREGMCGWSMCLVFFFFLASLSSFLFWCGHASVLALGSRFRPGCSFRPGCIHHFSLFRSPSRPFWLLRSSSIVLSAHMVLLARFLSFISLVRRFSVGKHRFWLK